MVLAIDASRKWPIQQLGMKNAFLHGTLSETVFCNQPTGFANLSQSGLICRMKKSL
jgi:hypothetical protein